MAHSYNGNASLATGGTVTITQPDDGDGDNAAAQNVPSSRLADWAQRFANFIINIFATANSWTAAQSFVSATSPATIVAVNTGAGAAVQASAGAGTGVALQVAGNATRGPVQLVAQAAPSTPSDGDVWVETTSNQLKSRINGTTYPIGGQMPTPLVVGGTGVAYENSFSAGAQPARYWIDPFGVVHFSGQVTRATATGATSAFHLPVGYRPVANRWLVVSDFTTGQFNLIEIVAANGGVEVEVPNNGDVIQLDGVTFETF